MHKVSGKWRRAIVIGTVLTTMTAPALLEPTTVEDVGCLVARDCQPDKPAVTSSKQHAPEPGVVVIVNVDEVAPQVVTPTYTLPLQYTKMLLMTPGTTTELAVAGAILDRLIHDAHKLQLEGESMRKVRAKRDK